MTDLAPERNIGTRINRWKRKRKGQRKKQKIDAAFHSVSWDGPFSKPNTVPYYRKKVSWRQVAHRRNVGRSFCFCSVSKAIYAARRGVPVRNFSAQHQSNLRLIEYGEKLGRKPGRVVVVAAGSFFFILFVCCEHVVQDEKCTWRLVHIAVLTEWMNLLVRVYVCKCTA